MMCTKGAEMIGDKRILWTDCPDRQRGRAAALPAVSLWGEEGAAIAAEACLEMLGFAVERIRSDMTEAQAHAAIRSTDITLVFSGTRLAASGDRDFSAIAQAACGLGRALATKTGFHAVVLRAALPPGTAEGVVAPIIAELSGKTEAEDFGMAVHAAPLDDMLVPEDVFCLPAAGIGVDCAEARRLLAQLMAPVHCSLPFTSVSRAERASWH